MTNDILIFVEHRNGRPTSASLQLFSAARDLTGDTGGTIHALVVGSNISAISDSLSGYGAASIIVADAESLKEYLTLPYTRVICNAIENCHPRYVLFATSSLSRDVAPRVAARLRAALATDCVAISNIDGKLHISRPVYCAKCVADIAMPADRLSIISVRPNTFILPEISNGQIPQIVNIDVNLTAEDKTVKLIEVIKSSEGTKDVAEADIVVSGGRSLQSEDNFKIIYELAEAMDGAVGASRAAVDAGYQPQSRQVGLTGKVVSPRLYVACGIDGAIQHLAGMRGSRVVVAINTKPNAPIFNIATYGCVADLFDMVPLITHEVERLNSNG